MIAGRPPGRVAKLVSAWADWLFAKLSPPEPRRDVKSDAKTQPPRLVKPDERVGRVASSARR